MLAAGFFRSASVEVIVVHVSHSFLATELTTLWLVAMLSGLLIVLAASAGCLLTIIAILIAGFHVFMEIVFLHSVVCHVCCPFLVRWLMARPEPNDSGEFDSAF